MTQQARSEKATKYLHMGLRAGLIAAIGVGSVLGIPPFVAAVDALMGKTLESWGDIASSSRMISLLFWWASMAFFALGAYGIWCSRLPLFHKCIGWAGSGLAIATLISTPSSEVSATLIGALIPAVGVVIWGCVQAVQLFMLMLHNNESAVRRLIGKLMKGSQFEYDDSLTPDQNKLKQDLAANKAAMAYAFFSTAGALGYVAELGVNLVYGQASIDWTVVYRPGGLWNLALPLLQSAIILIFTIGSIEACAMGLIYLDEMTEAIKD